VNKLKKQLQALLDISKISRLNDLNIITAKEFLTYNEPGLCFDHIVTQMYEYDIEINEATYQLICDIGDELKLPIESYSFMKKLVKI
jgi:hypothetical protein